MEPYQSRVSDSPPVSNRLRCSDVLRPLKTGGLSKTLGRTAFIRAIAADRLPRGCQKKSPRPVFAGQGLRITEYQLFPLDGVGSAVPSLQLHPVFGIDTERVPPNDAMSRFVGFGDKSWDNLKNFFQTQGFEFLFLSQSARRVAFGGSMAPKTPVLKLNRPFARKPPAAIASELTRVACAPFAKPQVAGLRHS